MGKFLKQQVLVSGLYKRKKDIHYKAKRKIDLMNLKKN